MAKDKGGFDSFVNPQLLNKNESKAAKRYGIDPQDYGFSKANVGIQKKDPRDFSKDVANAAMNDYDTRRTIEAAAMAGKNKAQKYAKEGFNSLEDVTKANNMFRKMHERAGNGGDFSSNSDYAGLTYGQVNRDRNKLMESIGDQQDTSDKPKKEDTAPQFRELSDRAKELVGMDDNTPGSTGPKSSSMSYDPNAGVSNAESGEFLSDYSFKVKDQQKKKGVATRGPEIKAGRLN